MSKIDKSTPQAGVGFHVNDEHIALSSELNALATLREDAAFQTKAAHIHHLTPPSVLSFFLEESEDRVRPLTFNANRHNIFKASLSDGEASFGNDFKSAVNREVADYFDEIATQLAAQTLNAETGKSADSVRLVIMSDMAFTARAYQNTAKLHIDQPIAASKRQLHGHIGISHVRAQPDGTHDNSELEYLTVGKDEQKMSDAQISQLLGYTGFAQDHNQLKNNIERTVTGDFLAFWSPSIHRASPQTDTLAHRTSPLKTEPQDHQRRYSVMMMTERPPTIDYGLDYI